MQIDSRKVEKGALFVAVKGVASDGHAFVEMAVAKGAAAIVCEKMPDAMNGSVAYVQVENSAVAAAELAHNFYGQPSEKIKLVGVTGTNGKTTIATLLYKLFTSLSKGTSVVLELGI